MSYERDVYEVAEIWEDRWFGPEEHAKVARLAESIPRDARSLLDVGCGNGLFLREVARQRDLKRLCGADRSTAALAHVTTEKVVASANDLPFAEGEFDIVTSFDVIEHLPLEVFKKTLSELARVARKYILVAVPFDEDIRSSLLECPSCMCRFNVNYHMRSFAEHDVRHLFDGTPFTCSSVINLAPVVTYPKAVTTAIFRINHVLGRTNGELPDYAICPVCGYRGQARTTLGGASQANSSRVKRVLKQMIPMRKTYRWIAALYSKS